MPKSGFLAILLAIFLTPVQPISAMTIAASCEAHPVLDRDVAGRAHYIVFPNGRTIVVVGHVHGDRALDPTVMPLIHSGKLFQMTNAQFADVFKKILATNTKPQWADTESNIAKGTANMKRMTGVNIAPYLIPPPFFRHDHQSVLEQDQEDYNYLLRLLERKETPNIQFVGGEWLESDWHVSLPRFYRLFRLIMQQYQQRLAKGPMPLTFQQLDDTMMSGTEADTYFYGIDPQTMRYVPMIGVENENVSKEVERKDPYVLGHKASDELLHAALENTDGANLVDRLKHYVKGSPQHAQFFAMLWGLEENTDSMTITKVAELKTRFMLLKKTAPARLAPELQQLYNAFKYRITTEIARNKGMATNLAALNKSGVDFVGFLHTPFVIRDLEKECTRELHGDPIPKWTGSPLSNALSASGVPSYSSSHATGGAK